MESNRKKQAAENEGSQQQQQQQQQQEGVDRDDSGSPVDAPGPSSADSERVSSPEGGNTSAGSSEGVGAGDSVSVSDSGAFVSADDSVVVSAAPSDTVTSAPSDTVSVQEVMSSGLASPVEKQDTEQTKEHEDDSRPQPPSEQPPQAAQDSQTQPASEESPPAQPPSPPTLAKHLEDEVLQSLYKSEHSQETGDSEEENFGSVSDNENDREEDLESQLYEDNQSESTVYHQISGRKRQGASLTDTDELLLNFEDGRSVISDIFEEVPKFRFGGKTYHTSTPYSPRYLSVSEKPKFSSKAYKIRTLPSMASFSSWTPRESADAAGATAAPLVSSSSASTSLLRNMVNSSTSSSVGYYLDFEETRDSSGPTLEANTPKDINLSAPHSHPYPDNV
ncbi:hypothetical protein ACOMHN_045531 [Nucella lapillus]